MYAETTKENLFRDAEIIKNFVIAKGMQSKELIELATNLKKNKDEIIDIYWLNGADKLNYPSFSSIIKAPRFVIKHNDIRFKSDELIFPQSDPIILIISNFDKLEIDDQERYLLGICKKEQGDYYPNNYLHEESIVIIGISSTYKMPVISYKLDVRIVI